MALIIPIKSFKKVKNGKEEQMINLDKLGSLYASDQFKDGKMRLLIDVKQKKDDLTTYVATVEEFSSEENPDVKELQLIFKRMD